MEDKSCAETRHLIDKAVDKWKSQLVDFTGRNRLIYYKELKVGTLNLWEANPSRVAALFEGTKVRLSALYATSARSGDDAAGDEPDQSRLDDATKRIRTVARLGLAHFEEKGIGTVFLTSHLMTWDAGSTSTATPNAPVLLVPLQVHRLGASQGDFELELAGEWEINQTLLIFWNEIFGAQIDQDRLSDLLETHPDDLNRLAQGVLDLARETKLIPSLELSKGNLIGNFHYTKLPMVKDLENATDLLAANDIIAAIAGDNSAATRLRKDNSSSDISDKIPDSILPEDEFLILDADSSQSHVINTVVAERSTIIEGPPGTGKSQTISNLVASLAARGKSVLFVAEKRAAIEAVLKRLEDVGLAELALDLHTTSIRKKDLAQALGRSLDKIKSTGRPNLASEHAELRSLRDQLVAYERELHRDVEPWGHSSFAVNAKLLDFVGVRYVELDTGILERLTDKEAVRVDGLVEKWTNSRMAIDWRNPWVNADLAKGNGIDQLIELTRSLRDSVPQAVEALTLVEDDLGLDLVDVSIDGLQEMLKICQESAVICASYGEELWELDLHRTASILNAKRLFRGSSNEYREVTRSLKKFRVRWVNCSDRKQIVNDAARAVNGWSELSLNGVPRDTIHGESLADLLKSVRSIATQIKEVLFLGVGDFTLEQLQKESYHLIDTEAVAILVGQTEALRSQLVSDGLEPLVILVEQGEVSESDAKSVLEHSILRECKRAVDLRNPVLNSFRAEDQHQRTQQYAEADRRHLESAVERVMREVAERAIEVRNQYPDENAVIERESKKKTRHKTLRQLQSEAGHVLTAIKPCWIMSPLMVAQSLPAEPLFDYVIFDEASQIRPEEAISAIARGRNLVVVGDRRQLPPSAFFDTTTADDVDEYDEDSDALTAGYESILDVTIALLPAKMLTWHYRSRDERLIALSNDHIYGGSLTTFPGSQKISPIKFCRVHHTPVSSVEVRSNPTEVAAVVNLMLEHARERSDESLGVIAFGQFHATAIDDALRECLHQEGSSELDDFFDESLPERVFVKNIERVQGDERDAIILSVGYGKGLSGRVPHRFGPLNQDGGERRINVAASRSRSRMTVVSSIGSKDLDVGSLGKGPQLLQHLLRFAETGGEDTGAVEGAQSLNAFELAVKFELEKLGFDPICQYGVSGFRIDFALPHPANDGRMVLAVEADGASYHSSATARDRDRLRQQILEDKGWHFHRIWSTAFFKDPAGEAAKVKTSFDRALRGDPDQPLAPYSATPAYNDVPRRADPAKPRIRKGVAIDDHDHLQLVALVRWITKNGENLLTEDEIKERMKEELGYARIGSKIKIAFERAIKSSG